MRALYVGDGSFIRNEVDFEDKSSFNVSGTIFYENTNCPVGGVTIKVDGQIQPDENGEIPVTESDGSFSIEVPIGGHYITAEKAGHEFSVGRFPATGNHDFQEDLAGINFTDATLVKVVGRVVGGLREGNKKAPGLETS